MYQLFIARLRCGVDRILTRISTLALLSWLVCKPAFADLPKVEAPSTGSSGGLVAQIKGYIFDGIVLGGLILAALAFFVVANAAVSTFAEVREGKSSWPKFGAIIVVGGVLIIVVIWLLTKSADILT